MNCVSHPLYIFNLALALITCQYESPLYWAARFSNRSAIAALMSAAADPHLGKSPLTAYVVSDEMKDYIRSLSN